MESKANPTNDLLIALVLLLIPLLIKLQPIAEKTNAVIEGKSYSALPYIVVIVPSTIFLVMIVLGVRAFFRTNEIKTDVSLKELEEEDDIMSGYALQPEPEVQPQQELPKEPEIEPVDIKKETESLLDKPLHLAANLPPEQRYLLEREGYLKKEFVPLGKTRRELYYIKEPKHEKIEQTFVVYAIVEKLKQYAKDITVGKRGISFFHKAKEYAFAVETPSDLRPSLHAKAHELTKKYGVNWWFIVTQSAYARSFGRYGLVLTRNQIDQWIREHLARA